MFTKNKGDGFAHASDEVFEAYRPYVDKELKSGTGITELINQLMQKGLSRAQASYLVDSAQAQLITTGTPLDTGAPSPLLVLVGALIAATVGGGAWMLVSVSFQGEFGFVAWAIGLLCGMAVLFFGRGHRGPVFQIIASLATVLGILAGKYGAFYFLYQENVKKMLGAEAADALSAFSVEVFERFIDSASTWVKGYDLIWVGLGVVTAWRIPMSGKRFRLEDLTGEETPPAKGSDQVQPPDPFNTPKGPMIG